MSRQETRLRIVHALDEYMATTSLERVKVTELCRRAGVGRATFYENFADVFAVGAWMWDYLMDGTLYQAGETLSCYDAHLAKFEILRQWKPFFTNAFKVSGSESIVEHGGHTMGTHCVEVYERKTGTPIPYLESLQLEFFITGAKHMTRHWIARGMSDEPAVMARIFTDAMPPFMIPLLEPDAS